MDHVSIGQCPLIDILSLTAFRGQQFVFGESDDDILTEGDDMITGASNPGRVMPLVSPANHPRRKVHASPLETLDESDGSPSGFTREGHGKRSLPALSRKGLVARGPMI